MWFIPSKNRKVKNTQSGDRYFNDVTEKLTRVISERGRNYANIRWYWQERDDFSQLQTSVGEVLAERCVKQPSELKSGK